MIRQTRFAVPRRKISPFTTVFAFILRKGVITLAALDGYRLAIRKGKPILRDSLNLLFLKRPLTDNKRLSEYEKRLRYRSRKTYYLLK